MIEFVTLFLALTWGVRPVEVAVGAEVAAVELRLDGELAGRLEGEPWSLELDFGEALVPHQLEAVALDGEGNRVGKARQTINFGRSAAEASLILGIGESAAPRRARVVWQAYDHSRPKKLRARFDGRKVPVSEDGVIELPEYDPQEPHLLAARLTFPDSLEAEAELSFGGTYSETVSSELTAVPVIFEAGTVPPSPAAMAGWFEAAGEPVSVFSAEQRPGVVFLVRDYHLPSPLPQATPEPTPSGLPGAPPPHRDRSRHEFRFVATTAHVSHSGPTPTAIFLIARVEEAWNRRGLLEVARYLAPQERTRVPQQLFEAVSLAARAAAATARPRAVVLLLDAESADSSRLSAGQTLGYLQSLRTPLLVWYAPRGASGQPSPVYRGLEELAGGGDLPEIVEQVQRSLDSQHVLWFQGPYLPHQIELTDAAPAGVRFAF